MPKIGDIVLTPFPFTDLSGNKVRPALVLGLQDGDDITVCFISSMIPEKISRLNVMVDPKAKGFEKTGLKIKSIIRATKIATLDRGVVLGKIGSLDSQNLQKVKKVLRTYFGL